MGFLSGNVGCKFANLRKSVGVKALADQTQSDSTKNMSIPQTGPPDGEHNPTAGIPAAAVARLSLYLREVRRMVRDDIPRVSSEELGRRLGVSAAIVRRDLATLGHLGRRGVGYEPSSLSSKIRSALGADKVWNVGLIGTGSLGTALLRYRGFSEQGFRLVAAFDLRPDRIGETFGGVPVLDLSLLEETITRREISLAILAVPAEAAQGMAERLTRAGVSGLLNFAPVTLSVGGQTCIANVDLASELQQLSFAVAKGLVSKL
jgi:redox-sensing transcriptional repressor